MFLRQRPPTRTGARSAPTVVCHLEDLVRKWRAGTRSRVRLHTTQPFAITTALQWWAAPASRPGRIGRGGGRRAPPPSTGIFGLALHPRSSIRRGRPDQTLLRARRFIAEALCSEPTFGEQFTDIAEACALAQAIVDTVREPVLVLDNSLRVIAASRSFYSAFKVRPKDTQGKLLYALGDGQWDIPKLRVLLEKIIPEHGVMEGYEVEHDFPDLGHRTMCLNACQVFYPGGSHSTILLGIEDITERHILEREKDELLRQKDVLLQELEHRVGNSLQIIASIILLKARTVESEETRLHLEDAHHRVISVAAVQKQIHASGAGGPIKIVPYLSSLCRTLATSMIATLGQSR